jgi:hypothetical protein
MSEARLTRRQAAIIGAFTGVSCGPFGDIHGYIDSFPQFKGIMTHNFASEKTWEEIKAAVKPDFLALCFEDADAPRRPSQSADEHG